MKQLATIAAAILAGVLLSSGSPCAVHAEGPFGYEYVSPRPSASLVSPATTIVLRNGEAIDEDSLSAALFHVIGSRSGIHEGQVVLADDRETVVFKPYLRFDSDEKVMVKVERGLTTMSQHNLEGIDFSFSTCPENAGAPPQVEPGAIVPQSTSPSRTSATPDDALDSTADYLTLPADFPKIRVTVPAVNTGGGYLFLSPMGSEQTYMLILDNAGDPVYYQRVTPSRVIIDFKKQSNGLLTYFDAYYGLFLGMDSSYNVTSSYPAGNGYRADHHDLQILPNGHYLVLIWDTRIVDMSRLVPGGQKDAEVTGLIVQEMDAKHNVVLEWRSWDDIDIEESRADLTAKRILAIWGNAIELDLDGNILISCRSLEQVIKISRRNGKILWRLGGKKNQFTFVNDGDGFHFQHDVRRLSNGNITLFDNRTGITPWFSRAVEYQLDEVNKTATRVWQYRNTPDTYSPYFCNTQRLPNGNTIVSWGLASPSVTEVTPDGAKAFELSLSAGGGGSYRIFRFPWQGRPTWPPVVVLQQTGGRTILHFSWNGATDIVRYRILAGKTAQPYNSIGEQTRQGFETTFDITAASRSYCTFRVVPVDSSGRDTTASNVVRSPYCSSLLPLILMD
jgi:hypothetical protein